MRFPFWGKNEVQRYVYHYGDDHVLTGGQRKNGVDVSLDAAELEGMSTEDLKRKYEQHSRGSAGVPGSKEDFSDMVAKEMAKKKAKMEKEKETRKSDKFKF